jgi:hypothetical protein
MAATIKFDQSGLPAGINNRSRSDIVAGTAVTITSVTPGTVETCELLWKPPEDDTAVISGSSPTWSIVPKVGTSGTYRIRLTVDGAIQIKTFTTLTPILALPIPAANEKADPTASLVKNTATEIDAAETNEAFSPFTGGSAWGTWPFLERIIRTLERLFNPSGGHAHTGSGDGGAVVAHSNLNDDQPEKHRLINDAGSSPTELFSSQKIDAELSQISSGYSRRAAVIDLVDNTAANWDGAAKGDIVEFNGTTWDATSPTEGWVSYVDLQNKDALYVDDGTPAWELRNVYSRLHSDLTDVSADQHHARDHASTHGPAQPDALKLDDTAAPDDNTDNDASASAHGLMKKLSGVLGEYLGGSGLWESRYNIVIDATLTGTVNDWNPTGWPTADVLVLTTAGTITGMESRDSQGISIKRKVIVNSTGTTVTLKQNDAGSQPDNRFSIDPQDWILKDGEVIEMFAVAGIGWTPFSRFPAQYAFNQIIMSRGPYPYFEYVVVPANHFVANDGAAAGLRPHTASEAQAILDSDPPEVKIKVYSQTTEPTLSKSDSMAIWIDTDDSNRTYILVNSSSGQKKIEVT